MDPAETPTSVVAAWQDALNARDHERVLSLSAEQIEIVGPRGSAHGLEVLQRWLAGTRVTLRPVRTFARGGHIVVAQGGTWYDPVSGAIVGESDVASLFEVAGATVIRYARFDSLAEALTAAGLDEADEVPAEGIEG